MKDTTTMYGVDLIEAAKHYLLHVKRRRVVGNPRFDVYYLDQPSGGHEVSLKLEYEDLPEGHPQR